LTQKNTVLFLRNCGLAGPCGVTLLGSLRRHRRLNLSIHQIKVTVYTTTVQLVVTSLSVGWPLSTATVLRQLAQCVPERDL